MDELLDDGELVSDPHEMIFQLIQHDTEYLDDLSEVSGIDKEALYRFFISCHQAIYDNENGAYRGMGS